MQRRAKVFMNNRSQAVRLPKEFQFNTDEVFIRKEGEDVILSPRPTDWRAYLDGGPADGSQLDGRDRVVDVNQALRRDDGVRGVRRVGGIGIGVRQHQGRSRGDVAEASHVDIQSV